MSILLDEPVAPPDPPSTNGRSSEHVVRTDFTPPRRAFPPKPVDTFKDLGLPDALIEAIVFRHLLAAGSNTCRGMALALSLPPKPTLALLTELKNRQLVVYKGAASMGDFEYTLTEAGRERARVFLEECTYSGPAPVPLADYIESVRAQTLENEHPGPEQLQAAFGDLVINDAMRSRLGPAINSGRGLFLYGNPGNGKTSIAERITFCFGSEIWIPKAFFVEGEIIQFHDPQCHQLVGGEKPSAVKGEAHDTRWIKIKRPTIVVGGELTMDSLELRHNRATKITEPSVQLKSNGGTLVIDDFGRQRMNPAELLNRWIVPLEKRYDYLTLANGKKIQVPFEQLIIFSTNLEPKQLVDDAFLRRIPYKINVADPSEEEFRRLMRDVSRRYQLEHDESAVDDLIERHYRRTGRSFRLCHPRDLILQIINQARYTGTAPAMTVEGFELACANYFTLL
jgi:predicted ATPase with chaperone activity